MSGEYDPDSLHIEPVEHQDPALRGYHVAWQYGWRFWLPILGPVPFLVWQQLISFCYGDKDTCWPSVSLLADLVAKGNRHAITGRWRGKGKARRRQPGALEILEAHGLLAVETKNPGPTARHTFHVVKEPPLLPPNLLSKLPPRLQQMHADLLRRAETSHATYLALARPPGALDTTPDAPGTTTPAHDTTPGALDTTKNYNQSRQREEIWRRTKDALRQEMMHFNYATYISGTHAVDFDKATGTLFVQAPSPIIAMTLRESMEHVIRRVMAREGLELEGVPIQHVKYFSKR